MILIKKPQEAPEILKDKGEKETRAMCEAYEKEGQRDFDFNAKIYGHKTVKEALITAQHDKCFLCESKISAIEYGDVEHFRPKKAYQQNADDDLNYPGYYWLAYDWENLFLSCQICNQQFKKNLFPLELPEERKDISHHYSWRNEKTLFINPANENPEIFISFRVDEIIGVVPFAINNNPKGKTTIKGTGIDRLSLCEKRMSFLKPLLTIYKLATKNHPQPESDEAKELLQLAIEDLTKDSAEFAGMFRSIVKDFEY